MVIIFKVFLAILVTTLVITFCFLVGVGLVLISTKVVNKWKIKRSKVVQNG